MKLQKGFTLIELMVVIVIIGILSALAIPKMFGVSAKAKAAEAPNVISNWETLQSAYAQETGIPGTAAQIGFAAPVSRWFTYTTPAVTATTGTINAAIGTTFGPCTAGQNLVSTYTAASDSTFHSGTATGCRTIIPNF